MKCLFLQRICLFDGHQVVLHLFYLGALRNQFLEEFGKLQNRWKKGNFLWYVTAGARIRMQLSNFSTVIKKENCRRPSSWLNLWQSFFKCNFFYWIFWERLHFSFFFFFAGKGTFNQNNGAVTFLIVSYWKMHQDSLVVPKSIFGFPIIY